MNATTVEIVGLAVGLATFLLWRAHRRLMTLLDEVGYIVEDDERERR